MQLHEGVVRYFFDKGLGKEFILPSMVNCI